MSVQRPPKELRSVSTKGIGIIGVIDYGKHEYDMPLVTTVGSSLGERGRGGTWCENT
jgi:hypothetical protein